MPHFDPTDPKHKSLFEPITFSIQVNGEKTDFTVRKITDEMFEELERIVEQNDLSRAHNKRVREEAGELNTDEDLDLRPVLGANSLLAKQLEVLTGEPYETFVACDLRELKAIADFVMDTLSAESKERAARKK